MFGGLFSSLVTPDQFRRIASMRANALLWEEAETRGHTIWKSPEDMELCRTFKSKPWTDFTEKELHIIDMLMLKYNDQPSPQDLSPERVIN
jgi:hypothetical protein